MNSDTDKMAAGASPDRAPSNPAAFPLPEDEFSYREPGMSLRDWFAGQALPTIVDVCRSDTEARGRHEAYFAEKAYTLADALLAERERRS